MRIYLDDRYAGVTPSSFFHACVLILLCSAITAQGATYYVSPTGDDSHPGTSDRPWQTPQNCVRAGSPLVAGDTCLVRAGVYADTDGDGITVYVRPMSPAGTAAKPITIKSEIPLKAVIKVRADHPGNNAGFYISKSYYIIEGFDIDGSGARNPSNTSSGAAIYGQGTILRMNRIHDIGRTTCSNSIYGVTGTYIRAPDVIVEQNQFFTIGRLRNGENGCSTHIFNHDHGVYAAATSNLMIRRNVFYDVNRGWPIHIYKPDGTTSNLSIYHNTFSGQSPTGKPTGHILLANTINGATIANNISYEARGGMLAPYRLTASNISVRHNITDTVVLEGPTVPGLTLSNNFEQSTSLRFRNRTTNDFRLTSRSDARDRGTTAGVPPVKDGAPDIGAYEFSEEDEDTADPLAPKELSIR